MYYKASFKSVSKLVMKIIENAYTLLGLGVFMYKYDTFKIRQTV